MYAVCRLCACGIGSCAQSISFGWKWRVFSLLPPVHVCVCVWLARANDNHGATATTIHHQKHFQTQHATKCTCVTRPLRSRGVCARAAQKKMLKTKWYMLLFIHCRVLFAVFVFTERSLARTSLSNSMCVSWTCTRSEREKKNAQNSKLDWV